MKKWNGILCNGKGRQRKSVFATYKRVAMYLLARSPKMTKWIRIFIFIFNFGEILVITYVNFITSWFFRNYSWSGRCCMHEWMYEWMEEKETRKEYELRENVHADTNSQQQTFDRFMFFNFVLDFYFLFFLTFAQVNDVAYPV